MDCCETHLLEELQSQYYKNLKFILLDSEEGKPRSLYLKANQTRFGFTFNQTPHAEHQRFHCCLFGLTKECRINFACRKTDPSLER